MSEILGRLGDLAGLGKDALIEVLSGVIDALGTGTELTGEQVARLGELQQKLADIIRGAGGGEAGA
jgi:hypothetical protein